VLPGLAKLAVVLMPLNCVWLKALKASSLASNLYRSAKTKRFDNERSQLLSGGKVK
jgi:hypothetical protein